MLEIVDSHFHIWDLNILNLPWLNSCAGIIKRSFSMDDIAKAYQEAILDFYDHGCRYLQIDDTSWTYLIDEKFLQKVEALGYTQKEVLNWFWNVSTKALEKKPVDMVVATHFCKGNFKG